ncbi:hypothetical protein HanPSC8_Chr14g0628871 [Helianthus annuus]|nr:hypothetical protein HanPSC8_Chr14g0628871 [Helianthus annuus]
MESFCDIYYRLQGSFSCSPTGARANAPSSLRVSVPETPGGPSIASGLKRSPRISAFCGSTSPVIPFVWATSWST